MAYQGEYTGEEIDASIGETRRDGKLRQLLDVSNIEQQLTDSTTNAPSSAVVKAGFESVTQTIKEINGSVYDLIIRTQEEFDAMIASSDWLGATNVAIVGSGSGEVDYTATRRIEIPKSVMYIYGISKPWIDINDASTGSTAFCNANVTTDSATWNTTIRGIKLTTSTGVGAIGYVKGVEDCTVISTLAQNGIGIRYASNVKNCEGQGSYAAFRYCGQNEGDICYGLRPTAEHTGTNILNNCTVVDIDNSIVEQWGDFENGGIKYSNGVMKQWGLYTYTSGNVDITLPVSYASVWYFGSVDTYSGRSNVICKFNSFGRYTGAIKGRINTIDVTTGASVDTSGYTFQWHAEGFWK